MLGFHNNKSVNHYEQYFSKQPVFAECFTDQSILEDVLLLHVPLPRGWQNITLFNNVVQVDSARLFYVKDHNPDWTSLLFDTKAHKVDICINPYLIATVLGIRCPQINWFPIYLYPSTRTLLHSSDISNLTGTESCIR